MTDLSMYIILIDILCSLGVVLFVAAVISVPAYIVATAVAYEEDLDNLKSFLKRKSLIALIIFVGVMAVVIPSKSTLMTVLAIESAAQVEGIEKLPQNVVDYLNEYFEAKNDS